MICDLPLTTHSSIEGIIFWFVSRVNVLNEILIPKHVRDGILLSSVNVLFVVPARICVPFCVVERRAGNSGHGDSVREGAQDVRRCGPTTSGKDREQQGHVVRMKRRQHANRFRQW
jgi:hypothetical protein